MQHQIVEVSEVEEGILQALELSELLDQKKVLSFEVNL